MFAVVTERIVTTCTRITIVLAALVASISPGGSITETPSPRFPQEQRLHLSLQHEVDAALARAALWLESRQDKDGSWCAGDQMATSLAVLSLQQLGRKKSAEAGRLWLLHCNSDNTFWHSLATGCGSTTTPLSTSPDPKRPFSIAATNFVNLSSTQAYMLAEVNRAIPDGLIIKPPHWRQQVAGYLISRQQFSLSPPGSGFWPEAPDALESERTAEAQTALAVLVLLQL